MALFFRLVTSCSRGSQLPMGCFSFRFSRNRTKTQSIDRASLDTRTSRPPKSSVNFSCTWTGGDDPCWDHCSGIAEITEIPRVHPSVTRPSSKSNTSATLTHASDGVSKVPSCVVTSTTIPTDHTSAPGAPEHQSTAASTANICRLETEDSKKSLGADKHSVMVSLYEVVTDGDGCRQQTLNRVSFKVDYCPDPTVVHEEEVPTSVGLWEITAYDSVNKHNFDIEKKHCRLDPPNIPTTIATKRAYFFGWAKRRAGRKRPSHSDSRPVDGSCMAFAQQRAALRSLIYKLSKNKGSIIKDWRGRGLWWVNMEGLGRVEEKLERELTRLQYEYGKT